MHKIGKLVHVLGLELREFPLQLRDALAYTVALALEEARGIVRQLRPCGQVLVQEQRGQLVRNACRLIRKAIRVGHGEGDRRRCRPSAARIDDIGTDHLHRDVIAHACNQRLAGVAIALPGVQVVAPDDLE